MSVKIRFRPLELDGSGVNEMVFANAITYYVYDDNTLELYDREGETIGHVHGQRWDVVLIVESEGA